MNPSMELDYDDDAVNLSRCKSLYRPQSSIDVYYSLLLLTGAWRLHSSGIVIRNSTIAAVHRRIHILKYRGPPPFLSCPPPLSLSLSFLSLSLSLFSLSLSLFLSLLLLSLPSFPPHLHSHPCPFPLPYFFAIRFYQSSCGVWSIYTPDCVNLLELLHGVILGPTC